MITGINQSKTLTKHIPCKYTFNGRKCNLNQNWSNYKFQCECVNKKHIGHDDFGVFLLNSNSFCHGLKEHFCFYYLRHCERW